MSLKRSKRTSKQRTESSAIRHMPFAIRQLVAVGVLVGTVGAGVATAPEYRVTGPDDDGEEEQP